LNDWIDEARGSKILPLVQTARAIHTQSNDIAEAPEHVLGMSECALDLRELATPAGFADVGIVDSNSETTFVECNSPPTPNAAVDGSAVFGLLRQGSLRRVAKSARPAVLAGCS